MRQSDVLLGTGNRPWVSSHAVLHFLESLAVTFVCCLIQSIAVFGLRFDSWIHELANFLRHYEAASAVARLPVQFVFAVLFSLNLIVVVIARRKREGDRDE